MKKNRVLYISYDGLTDPLGQAQILPYLINLSKLNYEITILSTEKEDNFLKSNECVKKTCDSAGIRWEWIKYTKSPPVLSTISDVVRLRSRAVNLNKKTEFTIVHCRSYISALVGLYMKRKFGTKFLFDMRGFWADERVDGQIWNIKMYEVFPH